MFAGTTVFTVLSLAAISAYAQKHDIGDCTLTSLPTIAPVVDPNGEETTFASSVLFPTFFWDGQEQQQCQPDCGGGRVPIKTDVPGCPGYTGGRATLTPLPLPTAATIGSGVPNATSTLETPTVTVTSSVTLTSSLKTTPTITRPATSSADLNPAIPSSGAMAAPGGRDDVFLWFANVVATAALALHV